MQREQKNSLTRRKIIDSALLEFAGKSYGEASLNTMCSDGNLSKGIIYHYFKDKDGLYLACVKECFDALTLYLSSNIPTDCSDATAALEGYFDTRIAFFMDKPLYLKLFCNAVISPPLHLLSDIAEIKSEFDTLNLSVLNKLLSYVKLRPDAANEDVVEFFREYQDFMNTRFQMRMGKDFTLEEHEAWCRRSLKILLYGVVERGDM